MLAEKDLKIRMTCNPFVYDKSGTRVGVWEKAEAVFGNKVVALKCHSVGSGHLSLNKNDLAPPKRSGSLARQSSFGSASTKGSNSSKNSRGKSQSRWR